MPQHRKPKLGRKLAPKGLIPQTTLDKLAEEAEYRGNPLHKRSPGGFDLDSRPAARPGRTLCDPAGVEKQEDAEKLLREGLRRGAVSDNFIGEWPKQVWAVTEDGMVLEAQYGNVGGKYHGYPVAEGDPIREQVLGVWTVEGGE